MITNAIASTSIKIPPRIRFAPNCMRVSNKEDMSMLYLGIGLTHHQVQDQFQFQV